MVINDFQNFDNLPFSKTVTVTVMLKCKEREKQAAVISRYVELTLLFYLRKDFPICDLVMKQFCVKEEKQDLRCFSPIDSCNTFFVAVKEIL